jgi:hypothetical protein
MLRVHGRHGFLRVRLGVESRGGPVSANAAARSSPWRSGDDRRPAPSIPRRFDRRPCARTDENYEAEKLFHRRLIEDLSLLKIRSEPKLEQTRERKSFGWSHAETAAIKIGHGFQPSQLGRFRSGNAWRCGTGRCGGINAECEELRREALVAMVHTTDLRDGDDFSDLGQSYRPLLRAILAQ